MCMYVAERCSVLAYLGSKRRRRSGFEDDLTLDILRLIPLNPLELCNLS